MSDKEEYSAATLRRKITPLIGEFVESTTREDLSIPSLGIELPYASADLSDIPALMEELGIPDGVGECPWMHGGQLSAFVTLKSFISYYLSGYDTKRNDPVNPYVSSLSPYLHFGMISPVTIYHEVMITGLPDVAPFLEELIVRRELAMNFVRYNPQYDSYEGLPEWARKTMAKHLGDERDYCYTKDQLEKAETHDRYWNTAQKELLHLVPSMGICACTGGRRYWNGVRHPRKLSPSPSISTTSIRWMEGIPMGLQVSPGALASMTDLGQNGQSLAWSGI